jgi:timeless protein
MALENFKTNGTLVNDCIFTMLHHVGCDLDRVDLLIEPVILRTFSKIWEDAFNASFYFYFAFLYLINLSVIFRFATIGMI